MSRLIFYGLIGFFVEVVFTAIWMMVDPKYDRAWTLHGLYLALVFSYVRNINLHDGTFLFEITRLAIVTSYSCVRLLDLLLGIHDWFHIATINACPWNYTGYTTYNVNGLIT